MNGWWRAGVRGIRTAVVCAALSCPAWSVPARDEQEALAAVRVPDAVFLRAGEDPAEEIWWRILPTVVELAPAPPLHPAVALAREGSAVAARLRLVVRVARGARRLYFRMQWPDATRDARRGIAIFPDAAAIQLPLSNGPASPMMGDASSPVAIWHWRADVDAPERLVAFGPGTLERAPSDSLRAHGAYVDGVWQVVFSVPVDAGRNLLPEVGSAAQTQVAFAVWQGSEAQRDGDKYVSGWLALRLDGGRAAGEEKSAP